MKITKTTHFWAWFKRHHSDLEQYCDYSCGEMLYWIMELNTHLRAYQRFFRGTILSDTGKPDRWTLAITSGGREKLFKMADRLVDKAPKLEGWEFLGQLPPMPAGAFIEERLRVLQLDVNNFWFSAADTTERAGRIRLKIYIETCLALTEEHRALVDQAVYNVLGERYRILPGQFAAHKIELIRMFKQHIYVFRSMFHPAHCDNAFLKTNEAYLEKLEP